MIGILSYKFKSINKMIMDKIKLVSPSADSIKEFTSSYDNYVKGSSNIAGSPKWMNSFLKCDKLSSATNKITPSIKKDNK
jgi:hypothetical protein